MVIFHVDSPAFAVIAAEWVIRVRRIRRGMEMQIRQRKVWGGQNRSPVERPCGCTACTGVFYAETGCDKHGRYFFLHIIQQSL